jgi:hypothetical protein
VGPRVTTRRIRAGLRAGAVAGVLSGFPSTVLTLAGRGDLFASSRAAGSLIGRRSVPAGLVVHACVSLGWGAVLGVVLPRSHQVAVGTALGAAIGVLNLGVIGRRVPDIRALPSLPQVLDHLAFGAVCGIVIAASDSSEHASGQLA